MASQEAVAELKVEQLKELAVKHNVEVASSDKKEDLVKKVSAAITPEDLEAYNKTQADESGDQGSGDAPEGDSAPAAGDGVTPPVAANPLSPEATDEAAAANTDVTPVADSQVELRKAEEEDNAAKEQAKREGAKEVDTKLGTSEEEAAAERAGVPEERLNDPKQNREPKNEFEQENQKVTEQERTAAQEVSDMSTKDRVENAPSPKEGAQGDAARTAEVNGNADIAQAIAEGFKRSKDDNFELTADAGVEPRFSLVKNKQGEVLLRENETGTLSKIQLESLEEKEASIQNQEVEEL